MKEKRTKYIAVRLTDDEYLQLKERKTKPRLAEWLREIALSQKSPREIKRVDPNFLYQLNKISTNINQIAKQCNAHKGNIDLIAVAISLNQIEKHLSELVNDY